MIDQFAQHLQKRIKEESDRISDALATGGASSFDNYRYMVGIIHGLAFVERELNDLRVAYDKE